MSCGSVLEASEEDWDFAFNLKARSMFRMIKAFLPGMIGKGGGVLLAGKGGECELLEIGVAGA